MAGLWHVVLMLVFVGGAKWETTILIGQEKMGGPLQVELDQPGIIQVEVSKSFQYNFNCYPVDYCIRLYWQQMTVTYIYMYLIKCITVMVKKQVIYILFKYFFYLKISVLWNSVCLTIYKGWVLYESMLHNNRYFGNLN